jgi:Skp family chaperone for outer membrane proteins
MKPKVKIIHWSTLYEKYSKPFRKKTDALMQKYDKEAKALNLRSTSALNNLWNKKYKAAWDRLDKEEDEAYKKLWLKYYDSFSSTQPKKGYKIVLD